MKASQAKLRIVPAEPRRRDADYRAAVSTRIEIAALTQALERGIENVTAEEVALSAGVSRRTFYRYFTTIDEALCAMPKRSLQRLAEKLSARPASENIFDALLKLARNVRYSPEELVIRKLANKVAQRSPTAWWKLIHRVGISNREGMEVIIAERLAATGEDPSRAGVITAVYLGVLEVVGRENWEGGKYGADAAHVEKALRDLAKLMRAAFPD